MKKILAVVSGVALVAATATSAVAMPTVPNPVASADGKTPVYLVMADQAARGLVTTQGSVVQRGTDALGTRVAVVKTTQAGREAMAADLPVINKKLADGSPAGSYRSFETLEQAQSFVNASVRGVPAIASSSFSIDQTETVKPLLGKIQEREIYTTIKDLSEKWPNRITTTSNARKAAEYLKDRYERLSVGKSYASTQFYEGCRSCGQGPVVMHTIQGTDRANEYVVIGGHYDSTIENAPKTEKVRAPGADDNASSQGTMLEALRVLHNEGWRPSRTVVFFSYPAEETGLNGSAAAADWFSMQGKKVVAHLGIDMTNYLPANRKREITFVSDHTDPALNQHLTQLVRTYMPSMRIGGWKCGYECSDHAPWTRKGVSSATLAEPEVFPRLHTSGDTLENMGDTAEPSVKFAQLSLAYLMETAKSAGAVDTKPTPTPTPTPKPTEPPVPTPTENPVPGDGFDDGLLTNGNFSQGNVGWTITGRGKITAMAGIDSGSLELSSGAMAAQSVKVSSRTTVSLWVKGRTTDVRVMGFDTSIRTGYTVRMSTIESKGEWKRLEGSAWFPRGREIAIQIKASGNIVIDQVCVN